MKLKFILLCILLSSNSSGCGTVNSEDKDDIKLTITAEPTLKQIPRITQTPKPTHTKSTQTARITQTPKPTVAYDYSKYSGEWICKDKHTNLTIEVDLIGKVEGGITTVIGDMVPNYSILGSIKDKVLISKLYDGDYCNDDTAVGSIVVYFTDTKLLKSTVKLDKPDKLVDVAVGDMIFKK